ncbi:MAG: hypothetical protein IJ225_05215 [Solobacterium sp.]|nr:hypothetical protein [Solobacterium sp.]
MITKMEADLILKNFSLLSGGIDTFDLTRIQAREIHSAWKYLWSVMEKEQNFSEHLGNEDIDWQIGNWAQDTSEVLLNNRLYKEAIQVNEQVLKIRFDGEDNLIHNNAKRIIADSYCHLKEPNKGIALYEGYLNEDPLWGMGWVGYLIALDENQKERFLPVLNEVMARIRKGEQFSEEYIFFSEMKRLCEEHELKEDAAYLEEKMTIRK